MDPSKLQADASNDTHSLESAETVIEEKDGKATATPDAGSTEGVTDATGGRDDKPRKSNKPPFFKRLWEKFNIYLMLFLLVIVIAVGVTVVMFIKNKQAATNNKATIDTQDLSDASLKQLANSSVNVGSSKQILNVESNAIFNGAVLVRSDLEVAGDIKVGGNIQLPGITVTGSSKFSQLQADTLTIGSTATVQGKLTAQNGISVNGNSTFSGSLSATQISTNSLLLNGDLTLTHHISAGGPIPGISRGTAVGSGGTASLNGSDTSGSITINTGGGAGAGCFATINFAQRFNDTPHVVITPVGSGAAGLDYYVTRSSTQFSVCTANAAPSGQSFGFDYMIFD